MIIGEYQNRISDGKRVALPKKFRDELSDKLILTRSYENSLVLVDKDKWENIASEAINGSFINSNVRDTSRFLIGSASEIDLDTQGRFVIPNSLFDYAKLETDIVFIGLVNWIEIWSKELWENRITYLIKNGSDIAQKLTGINK